MSFLNTTAPDEATGEVAELYGKLTDALGYLPNYGRIFSLGTELFEIWVRLNKTVTARLDPRTYELATLAAAAKLSSSYCALAHGEKLLALGSDNAEVRSIAIRPTAAGLSDREQAVVDYATKVARSASEVSEADIDRLRSVGLSDQEIFDIASAVAMRCFFSTLLDAVGTVPDARFHESIPDLVDDLQLGRAAQTP